MKISDDILAILSGLDLTGSEARIAAQLDRKTYVRVNQVLEACGGKWNRKARAHIFPGDAAERIDAVILSGEVTTPKDLGFFATPPDLAAELVAMADVRPGHHVLEPSAGDGAIVRALVAAGASVTAVEIDYSRVCAMARDKSLCPPDGQLSPVHGDFLLLSKSEVVAPPDRVVMNPPFGRIGGHDQFDHVWHAFRFLREGGVLVSVLPSGVTFRQDRRHVLFRDWVAEHGGEIMPLPKGSFRASGTGVNTCMLRVVRGAQ